MASLSSSQSDDFDSDDDEDFLIAAMQQEAEKETEHQDAITKLISSKSPSNTDVHPDEIDSIPKKQTNRQQAAQCRMQSFRNQVKSQLSISNEQQPQIEMSGDNQKEKEGWMHLSSSSEMHHAITTDNNKSDETLSDRRKKLPVLAIKSARIDETGTIIKEVPGGTTTDESSDDDNENDSNAYTDEIDIDNYEDDMRDEKTEKNDVISSSFDDGVPNGPEVYDDYNEEEKEEISESHALCDGSFQKEIKNGSDDVPLPFGTANSDAAKIPDPINDSQQEKGDVDIRGSRMDDASMSSRSLSTLDAGKSSSKRRKSSVRRKRGSVNGIPLTFLTAGGPKDVEEAEEILRSDVEIPVKKIVHHEKPQPNKMDSTSSNMQDINTDPNSSSSRTTPVMSAGIAATPSKSSTMRDDCMPTIDETERTKIKENEDKIDEEIGGGNIPQESAMLASIDDDSSKIVDGSESYNSPSKHKKDSDDESISEWKKKKHSRFRRIMALSFCVGLLACIVVVTVLQFTVWNKNDDDGDGNVESAGELDDCLSPIEEQSILTRCFCSNSTGNFYNEIGAEGQTEYQRLKNFLFASGTLDSSEIIETNECDDYNVVLLTAVDFASQSEEGLDYFKTASDDFQLAFLILTYIFVTMGGSFWKQNGGWLSADMCAWFGLTCSFDDVVQLNVPGNGLNGSSIPSSIGLLTSIRSLVLHDNDLAGTIPTELGNLQFLRTLNLGMLGLEGTIPEELASLQKLDDLDLSFNSLTGWFPSNTIHLIPNLRFLNVRNNDFNGRLPPELSLATNLIELDLGGNDFSGTLPNLGRLTSLEMLGFQANRFEGTIPSFLGRMTNLRYLKLYNSGHTGPIPETFCNETHPVNRVVVIDCRRPRDCSCCSRTNQSATVQLRCVADLP